MRPRQLAIGTLLLAPLALGGCGGGRSDNTIQNVSVTRGQQLLDLKKSLDAGAVSQDDYERQRLAILAAP